MSRPRRKRRPTISRWSWRYYAEAVSGFGWLLIGLLVLWLVAVVVAIFVPEVIRVMVVFGGALVLVGNLWVCFVAYRDSHVFGMLCFFTCLFVYAYIFMNPDETWWPAGLTGIGILFVVSAGLVAHLTGIPRTTP